MRESFADKLNVHSGLAREEQAETSTSDAETVTAMQELIDEQVALYSTHVGSNPEVDQEIYLLQLKKQDIMKELKENIASLDEENPIDRIKSGKSVWQDGEAYWYIGPKRTPMEITLGEIMTDSDWGMTYRLDNTVPRNMRKRYYIELAKQRLRKLLDEQITLDETENQNLGDWLEGAYLEKKKAEEQRAVPTGIIAEQMVQNLFLKYMYDAGLDIEIVRADVHQDVYEKIDFIIRMKKENLGVGVKETTEEVIGIQFTTNTSPEAEARKLNQLAYARKRIAGDYEHIDKIVLVQIPLQSTRRLYEQWRRQQTPGGPDKLWDDETKEKII